MRVGKRWLNVHFGWSIPLIWEHSPRGLSEGGHLLNHTQSCMNADLCFIMNVPPQYDSDDAVNKLLGLDGWDCSLLLQDQSHAWISHLTTPAELQLPSTKPTWTTQLPELLMTTTTTKRKWQQCWKNVAATWPSNSWNWISSSKAKQQFLSQLQASDLWERTWGMFVAVHAWFTHN